MSTTAATPGLEVHRVETEITNIHSAEDIHLGKPVCGAKACKKENECVCDPESLKIPETKQSPQPQTGDIPEVDMTPAQVRRHKLEGIRVILGGGLMHLVIGTFYLWGAVSLYVASYYRSKDPSIDINLVKLVYPLMLFAITFGMPFGIKFSQRFGARKVSMAAMAVISGSVFASGFMDNFWGLVFFYGLLFGFASGMIYMVPVACSWKYFPHKKGTASGFIIGCFGFGTLIFNYVAMAIVNPGNEGASLLSDGTKYFAENIYKQVPVMFKILSGFYLVIGMTGALLVSYPKTVPKSYIAQIPAPKFEVVKSGEESHARHEVDTVQEGLKSSTYRMLLLITITTSFYGLFLNNNYKVYGMITIKDDLFLTTVGSVGAASNGISRFVWAYLTDKYGYKKMFSCMLVIQAIVAATFSHISHSKPLYIVWYMISMSCQGGTLTMQPTITAKVFGPKKSSMIYPFVYLGFCISTLASFFLTRFGQETIGWPSMFWIVFGISIIPFPLLYIFNDHPTFIMPTEKFHPHEDKKAHKSRKFFMFHDHHHHDDHDHDHDHDHDDDHDHHRH